MADILFVTWDGGGNVPPATALAHELRAARARRAVPRPRRRRRRRSPSAGLRGSCAPRHARALRLQPRLHRRSPMLGVFARHRHGPRPARRRRPPSRPTSWWSTALMFGALHAARRRRAALRRPRAHVRRRRTGSAILGGPMGLNLRLRRLAPRRALDGAALRLLMTLPDLDPRRGRRTCARSARSPRWSPARRGRARRCVVSLSTFGYAGMRERPAAARRRDRRARRPGASCRPGRVVDPGDDPGARPASRCTAGCRTPRLMPTASVLVDATAGTARRWPALAHDLPLLVDADGPACPTSLAMGRSVAGAGAGRVVADGRRRPRRAARRADASCWPTGPHRGGGARLGAAVRAHRRASATAPTALEELLSGRSCGARSPRGSTVTSARPSQSASRRSSARSSSAVSSGAPASAYAALTTSAGRLDLRSALRSTRADDLVAEQERQHVVAVHPLVGRGVDLDPVVEVEERLGALPLPHDRVERAQQRPGLDPARQPRVAVEVRRPLPALDRDRQQLALLDQLGDGRSRRPRPASGSSRAGPARSPPRGSAPPGGPARGSASSGVGVGRARTSAGMTRSGRS